MSSLVDNFDMFYLGLAANIIKNGHSALDRTSVGSNKKVFGVTYKYEVGKENRMPFMFCRAFNPRIAFEELMWMLRGQTDAKILQDKGIRIWDGNTTREFLDKNGLHDVPTGFIGKGYGYQMRSFGGVDQLQKLFDGLKNNPNDRRHIINFWNVPELPEMALPPCHYDYQFVPVGNILNLRFTLRSSDVVFGLPYNMAFAAMWLSFFSKALKMTPGEIMYVGTDVHVYSNQFELVEKTTTQFNNLWKGLSLPEPKININKELSSLDDILALEYSDIEVIDLPKAKNPELDVKVEMAQ